MIRIWNEKNTAAHVRKPPCRRDGRKIDGERTKSTYLIVRPADVQVPVLLGPDADGVGRDVLALGQNPRRGAGRAFALVALRALLGLGDPVVQRPDLRLLLLAVLLVLLVGLVAGTEESSASEETTTNLRDILSPHQRERWRERTSSCFLRLSSMSYQCFSFSSFVGWFWWSPDWPVGS